MKKGILLATVIFFISLAAQAQLRIQGKKQDVTAPCTTMFFDKILNAVDTTKGRSVADNYKTWENGEVILVKFMDNAGSQNLRNRIMQYAKEWEAYGNVIFKFLEKGNVESLSNQHIFDKAQKDALTGAFNKGALLEKGPELVRRAEVL